MPLPFTLLQEGNRLTFTFPSESELEEFMGGFLKALEWGAAAARRV